MSLTIRDVAKKAGVGVGTVSRVLNGHTAVSAATRQRVLETIAELNYTPNQTARRLSTGKTMSIGVVAPFFTSPSVVERLRGIESVFSITSYDLIIYNVEGKEQLHKRFRSLYSNELVDGLLTISVAPNIEETERFQAANIPFVVVDSYVADMVCVCVDDEWGGYQATKHLIDLNHQRIGYISDKDRAQNRHNPSLDRFHGLIHAFKDAGMGVDESMVVNCDQSRYGGYEAACQLFAENERRPTAIFCASDVIAMGALQAADEFDIEVPHELSVIGYDDIEMAEYLNLSTVRQPLYDSGVAGAKLLLRAIESETIAEPIQVLPTQLVPRGTTAPAPRAPAKQNSL